MTQIDKLLAEKPELRQQFAQRAADPAVSGDMLLAELQAAGLPAKRSAVFLWRQAYRSAKRHRPNSLKGRLASALRTATPGQLRALNLPQVETTAAVFKLGRSRLYRIARSVGLYPPAESGNSCALPVNDA